MALMAISIFFLLFCLPANAAPWPKRLAKITGRSVKVMAMPWTDPRAALAHYAIFGADIADYYSTAHVLAHCPGCQEINPVFSKRPSAPRLFLEGLSITLVTEHDLTQWEIEGARQCKCWQAKFGTAASIAVPVTIHSLAANHNLRILDREEHK